MSRGDLNRLRAKGFNLLFRVQSGISRCIENTQSGIPRSARNDSIQAILQHPATAGGEHGAGTPAKTPGPNW